MQLRRDEDFVVVYIRDTFELIAKCDCVRAVRTSGRWEAIHQWGGIWYSRVWHCVGICLF